MDFNILIGGAAGQGMETLASTLEKVLKRKGFEVFTIRDYMSRVRGGHNFIQIRFGNEELSSHIDTLDVIIALNEETVRVHIDRLNEQGFILCDEEIDFEDQRLIKLPLVSIAKNIGNIKVFGNVALGALLMLFNMDLSHVDDVLSNILKPELVGQNKIAFEEGYRLVGSKFEIENKTNKDKILINGNEALALGVLAAGCKFYSAYPMTPSTSIMNYLASKMKEGEIVVEQAEDEIAAINMAIGASYAGVRAMTGTSGGGFALMVEALGLSGMLEVPLVVAEVQRPGPTTGLPTRTEQGDLRFAISSTPGEFPRMVIALKDPKDAFYQTMRAFNLADKYQIPVILLSDQFLADYTSTIEPFDFSKVKVERYLSDDEYRNNKQYKRYEITPSGISPRIIPGNIPGKVVVVDSDEHDEYGHISESASVRVAMNDKRLRKMDLLKQELQEPEFLGEENYNTLIVAWGSLYGPVKEAVRQLNKKLGTRYAALIFGDIYPLPMKSLERKAKVAKEIINIEQNATGQLASLIMEFTGLRCTGSVLKYDGRPISAQEICDRLEGV